MVSRSELRHLSMTDDTKDDEKVLHYGSPADLGTDLFERALAPDMTSVERLKLAILSVQATRDVWREYEQR